MKKKKKPNLPVNVPPLTTYYMYITSGCNLACRHCWINPSFEHVHNIGEYFNYKLFKIAVDEALPLGLNRIKFTGGEPLLHPDFIDMVNYATERGIRSDLETNGTLISQNVAKHLKEKTSLHFVSVSLDGIKAKTHEYLRNVEGCFNQTLRGIKYLVNAGYQPQLIMSLYSENIDEIESLIKLAIKNRCGSVKFNIIQPSGRGEQMKKNNGLLSVKDLIRLGHWVEKELQPKYSIPLFFSWPMAFHGIARLHKGAGENCNIFYILGILSSGEMAMCGIGTQEKDLIYGYLGKDNVFDVWSSAPGLKKLREVIPHQLEGICSQCLFKKRCLGTCVAQNYHATKSLTAPFWFCRQADEIGLFPSKRKFKKIK